MKDSILWRSSSYGRYYLRKAGWAMAASSLFAILSYIAGNYTRLSDRALLLQLNYASYSAIAGIIIGAVSLLLTLIKDKGSKLKKGYIISPIFVIITSVLILTVSAVLVTLFDGLTF